MFLACLQCRTRHFRCDAAIPTYARCQKEGKPCSYARSRRVGSCRAAVAQERADNQRLQESHANGQQPCPNFDFNDHDLNTTHIWNFNPNLPQSLNVLDDPGNVPESVPTTTDKLLTLYFPFFHNAHPCALPQKFIMRRMGEQPALMKYLGLIMSFIGSLYAPSVDSEPCEEQVLTELSKPGSS